MSMGDDCDDVFSVALFLSFTEIAFQNSCFTPFCILIEPLLWFVLWEFFFSNPLLVFCERASNNPHSMYIIIQ